MFLNRLIYILCIVFFACTSNAQAGGNREAQSSGSQNTSAAEADAAAQDAARRLDDALSGRDSIFDTGTSGTGTPSAGTGSTGAQTPVQATSGGPEPRWVNDPYTAYSRNNFVAAVGLARNRAEAEVQAFAALTAIFGQSIQSNFEVARVYSEAVRSGIVTVSDDITVRDTVGTAALLDRLVGAEIGSVWDNGRGMVYALAYLNKERAIVIYSEMIALNLANIDRLISMSAAERNTFDGYARYKLAALISGINDLYANVVTQAGGSRASLNLSNTEALNIDAANILGNITVEVQVTGDSRNRVRDAFAGVLQAERLRTGGANPPYSLKVIVHMEEAVFPGNPNKFARITISAELIDNATNTVLLPFNHNERGGHATLAEAENRAFTLMAQAITEKYSPLFKEYLAALMPQR